MRKLIIFLSSLILLTSCNANNTTSNKNLDYSDFATISSEQIFNMNENNYAIYFYSLNCSVCNSMKNDIFSFAEKVESKEETRIENLYFLEATISNLLAIPYYFEITQGQEQSEENYKELCLGASNLSEMSYYGYPTLFILNNDSNNKKIISSIFLGRNEILNYIKY